MWHQTDGGRLEWSLFWSEQTVHMQLLLYVSLWHFTFSFPYIATSVPALEGAAFIPAIYWIFIYMRNVTLLTWIITEIFQCANIIDCKKLKCTFSEPPLHTHTVSSARMVQSKTPDSVLKDPCEEEMDTLKLELQHCKDFIQTQQQLLQVSCLTLIIGSGFSRDLCFFNTSSSPHDSNRRSSVTSRNKQNKSPLSSSFL